MNSEEHANLTDVSESRIPDCVGVFHTNYVRFRLGVNQSWAAQCAEDSGFPCRLREKDQVPSCHIMERDSDAYLNQLEAFLNTASRKHGGLAVSVIQTPQATLGTWSHGERGDLLTRIALRNAGIAVGKNSNKVLLFSKDHSEPALAGHFRNQHVVDQAQS